jgi:hypothetical protein
MQQHTPANLNLEPTKGSTIKVSETMLFKLKNVENLLIFSEMQTQ